MGSGSIWRCGTSERRRGLLVLPAVGLGCWGPRGELWGRGDVVAEPCLGMWQETMFWARAPVEKTGPWRGKHWLGRGLSRLRSCGFRCVSQELCSLASGCLSVLSAGSAVSPVLPEAGSSRQVGGGVAPAPRHHPELRDFRIPRLFPGMHGPSCDPRLPTRRSSLRWGQTARPRYPQPPSICVKRAAGTLRAWAHQPCPEQGPLIGLPQQSPALTQSPGASSPRTFWNTQLYHGLRSSTRQPPPSASRSLTTPRSRQVWGERTGVWSRCPWSQHSRGRVCEEVGAGPGPSVGGSVGRTGQEPLHGAHVLLPGLCN